MPPMWFLSQKGRASGMAGGQNMKYSKIQFAYGPSVFGYQAQLLQGMKSLRATPAQTKFPMVQTTYIFLKAQSEATTERNFKAIF